MQPRSRGSDTATHYAGVAVRVRAERFHEACAAIDAIPDVEVRLRHPDGERLIAVVESPDTDGQIDALRRIRGVVGVLVAAPAFHLIDDPANDGIVAGPRPARAGEPRWTAKRPGGSS